MLDKRISLFCGHYGSGKTEISINAALNLKEKNDKVAIVDLDIINPYFRTAEHHELFKKSGIRLLSPTFAMTTVDIPGLPAQIQSVFDNPVEKVVFDVGGDDTGAVALGRYKHYLEKDSYAMYFVINVLRPFSSNVDDIEDLYRRICYRARIEAAGIINNTNYGAQTSAEDVIKGHEIILQASKRLDIPVSAVCAREDIAKELPDLGAPVFPIKTRMLPEWM